MPSLQGKAALVTGGTRGIGAAIVRRLAPEGANVAFTYHSSADKAHALVAELEALGRSAVAIQADAADAKAVIAAVDTAADRLGRLDILVNNAGVAVFAPVGDFDLAEFDRTMAVNVRAVFAAAHAASRRLSNGGRIITIGSVNADSMPFQGGSVYTASKAAVAGMTRGLARDFAPRDITVNVIAPGPIDTDMNPANGPVAAMLVPMLAIPRYGEGKDIAGMTAFLAGPDASYITGASFTVDGGFLA
jgi:3-oxoacyl-[acyl-carrier protein] reductase